MKSKNRILGIDIIKAVACILVIFLHTSAPAFSHNGVVISHTLPSQIVYYLGTGAVPLFFMANAFFIINRSNIDHKYISKKIFSVLIPVILWNSLLFIGYLIKHEERNYFHTIVGSLLQKGFFFQFWFLGSLIVMLLFAPLFNKLLKRSPKYYMYIFFAFCLICYTIDIANHLFFSVPLQSYIIQTFRLWTWFAYYLLGGILGHIYYTDKSLLCNKHTNIITLSLTVISIIYSILNKNWIHNFYAEFNYDNLMIMLWVTALFILLLSINRLTKRTLYLVKVISSNSMGIYIVHVPILKVFNHFILIDNFTTNMLAIITVFIVSLIISFTLSRIPLLRYLVKL